MEDNTCPDCGEPAGMRSITVGELMSILEEIPSESFVLVNVNGFIVSIESVLDATLSNTDTQCLVLEIPEDVYDHNECEECSPEDHHPFLRIPDNFNLN
jgi:hypothetical protein